MHTRKIANERRLKGYDYFIYTSESSRRVTLRGMLSPGRRSPYKRSSLLFYLHANLSSLSLKKITRSESPASGTLIKRSCHPDPLQQNDKGCYN